MITGMNTETYKAKLLEEKKLVESELATIAVRDEKTGEWSAVGEDQGNDVPVDDNELGNRFESLDESESLVKDLSARLSDINRAIEKIANGKFGACEIDGKMIEEGRLEANPAARTCIEHKEHSF